MRPFKCLQSVMSNANHPQFHQQTVLLVATDPPVREYIAAFLVSASYKVLSAKDGEEGVQHAKKYGKEIDLILSTLDMPGVNGLGVAAQVSTMWPNVKVLLMSECRAGTLILNEGWHFLPKPFVESQLKALILTLLTPEGGVPKYRRPGLPPDIVPAVKEAAAN